MCGCQGSALLKLHRISEKDFKKTNIIIINYAKYVGIVCHKLH